MKRSLKIAVCGMILVFVSGVALAEFGKPEEAIYYRKAVMAIIAQHFGHIAGMIKGQIPYDQSKVKEDTAIITTMSKLPWEAMLMPGSDKGDTTLKPSAMADKDAFMAIAKQFEDAAKKLAETAKNGGLEDVKAQFGQVAMNCKACHGTYRKK
jgi:cytochrome c556